VPTRRPSACPPASCGRACASLVAPFAAGVREAGPRKDSASRLARSSPFVAPRPRVAACSPMSGVSLPTTRAAACIIPRRSVGHRRACARPWSRHSRWRSGLGCWRGPSVREAGVRTDSGSSHRRAHGAFRCAAPARRGAFADGAYPSIARLPVFHKICFTMLVAWAKASDGLPLQ
jgi:hypothetical protein